MSTNKMLHFSIALATILIVKGSLAAKPISADYARPLSFEPNRGQMSRQVDYVAHGAGYNLLLSHGAAVIVFRRGTTVLMSPVGANASFPPEPLEQQPSKTNYFIGNVPEKWHTHVENYGKIRYQNAYPGIDLFYYGNQRQLEYDFVVSPGADPRKILLEFQGARTINLDRSGDLVARTGLDEMRWHKPVAYQQINGDRKLIACDYLRKGGQLGFRLAAYDRNRPLIIDPVLDYSTYLGDDGADLAAGIAVDGHGNAYITGTTNSVDFPATKGTFQYNYPGFFFNTSNAFVAKFDAAGKLVYSTYLGGSGSPDHSVGDLGNAIAVDVAGNAYITGATASPDFPTKNAFQNSIHTPCTQAGTCGNAFVTKLDAAGSELVYSTYLGGSTTELNPGAGFADQGLGIAVDSNRSAYVTGLNLSSDFPTKNAFQIKPGTVFVTKLEPAGNKLAYSTYLGGNGFPYDQPNGIAVDSGGNAYIAGVTSSSDFPTKNAFQKKLAGFSDAFVTKFDAAGNALVYSTYLGGSEPDGANGIALDAHGNAYVTGVTSSTDFPLNNAGQKRLAGSSDAFITKFDAAGNELVYSTYLGGDGGPFTTQGNGIAVDANGNAYVAGYTQSPEFPIKNAFQSQNKASCGSCGNAFVTKLDAAGTALVYSSYLGGMLDDTARAIGVDTFGNAWLTGRATSPDFPTKNPFQPAYGGGTSDAFVTKISAR